MGFSLNVQSQSKIYKYTDIDGNIHYSDTKPFEEAQEVDIKPVTIIESPPVTNRKRSEHKKKFNPIKFDNFVISTPEANATLWNTGGNVLVSVNLADKLPSHYRVVFYLDEQARGKLKSSTQLIPEIERGEHTIFARLTDINNHKTIKTTEKITFHVKQHSKK